MNPAVNEFESIICENNKCLNISINNIIKSLKLIMGEFSGILDLCKNIEGTVEILCKSFDEENYYNKMQLGDDNRTLLGILFAGKTTINNANCLLANCITYSTIFHFTIFSVVTIDNNHVKQIIEHFNTRFNNLSNVIDSKYKEYKDQQNKFKNKSTFNLFGRKLNKKSIECSVDTLRHPPVLYYSDFSNYVYPDPYSNTFNDSYYDDTDDTDEFPLVYNHNSNLDVKDKSIDIKNKLIIQPDKDFLENPNNIVVDDKHMKKIKNILHYSKSNTYNINKN
uniref:Uncharacterized protein n=1 Tax=Megaviridae environmental sample TaxID=1737588 RepID=A0A5J6VJS8_9VIRU|nr:MAG: hypothetical protein [Megaviridae environmental sample]